MLTQFLTLAGYLKLDFLKGRPRRSRRDRTAQRRMLRYRDKIWTAAEQLEVRTLLSGTELGGGIYLPAEPIAAGLDFGDAPESYGTTIENDGARHEYDGSSPPILLGYSLDTEQNGIASPDAHADDESQFDDEDGLAVLTPLISDPHASRSALIEVIAPNGGMLQGWMDFNRSGTFDPDESLFGDGVQLEAGVNVLAITIPPGISPGDVFARFRLSSAGGLGPTGYAADGEVEDERWTIAGSGASMELVSHTLASSSTAGSNTSTLAWNSVSADGRYVAFQSIATNLVTGDTNLQQDIFRFDRQTGEIQRVSVSSSGEQAVGGAAMWYSMSDDGQRIVFGSHATNLDGTDPNGTLRDIYVHTFSNNPGEPGTTRRLEFTPPEGVTLSSPYDTPSISGNGRYVAFQTTNRLLLEDTDGGGDIYVYDLETDTFELVSISLAGGGGGIAFAPKLSHDGRYVLYVSSATNIVAGDTNAANDVYVYDRVTQLTERVSVSSTGAQGNGASGGTAGYGTAMSDDGRFVVFLSAASNLVDGDTNSAVDVFLRDRLTGETIRVSQASDGSNSNGTQNYVTISGDGRFVGFYSTATNLVPDGRVGLPYFIYDRETGSLRRASGAEPPVPPDTVVIGDFSRDGRFLALSMTNWSLWPGDNASRDVFLLANLPVVPAVTRSSVTVAGLGLSAVIDAESLDASSAGVDAADLQYVVRALPQHGTLQLNGEPLGVAHVFTQDDVNEGRLSYHHGGVDLPFDSVGLFLSNGQGGISEVVLSIAVLRGDFGDAPDSYGTTSANNGARHLVPSSGTNPVLGSMVDLDADGQPTVDADGDNQIGDNDEEGVRFLVPLAVAADGSRTAVIEVTAHAGGVLQAWIDFNQNGQFDAEESLFGDGVVLQPGVSLHSIEVPEGTLPGATYARFRISSTGGLLPTGTAPDGEVEDYRVYVETFSTTLVSTTPLGLAGNNASSLIGNSISADNRFVVFSSTANNLVAGDTNNASDVFVYDRLTGVVERVSVASNGGQVFGVSSNATISNDGRYVAFESMSNQLVPGDTNARTDVFVHDRQTGQTRRISVSSTGEQGNGNSLLPQISGNGRYVAFESDATNLVAGDVNNTRDVFVYDVETGLIECVSVDPDGTMIGGNAPKISGDGRFVAYFSFGEILIYDRMPEPGTPPEARLQSANYNNSGEFANAPLGNANGFEHDISDDGRFLVFSSNASNLVPADTNGTSDIFVRDLVSGTTRRVNLSASGVQGNSLSTNPTISADGRYVAFRSLTSTLVAGDTNAFPDYFIVDTITGVVRRMSVSSDQTQANGLSSAGAISDDGQFLAFATQSTNLVEGDLTSTIHIVISGPLVALPDPMLIETILVSRTPDGTTGNGASVIQATGGTRGLRVVSADGKFIVFASTASDLVEGDTGISDIFLFDVESRTLRRISDDSLPATDPSISADGRHIAYLQGGQVIVYSWSRNPQDAGDIEAISFGANGPSFHPSLSGDGRYVTFSSAATNLVPGVDANGTTLDIFVYDRMTGEFDRANVSSDGVQSNGISQLPVISDNGRYLVYSSNGQNLVPGDTNSLFDLFVFDRVTRTTERVSLASAAEGVTESERQANGHVSNSSISADGRFVVYQTLASNLVDGDTNGVFDVFVYDRLTQTTERISLPASGIETTRDALFPAISGDGRFVAFATSSNDFVSGDVNGVFTDVILFDRATQSFSLVSVGAEGQQGTFTSTLPSISFDGSVIPFVSNASNFALDPNGTTADVFYRRWTPTAALWARSDSVTLPENSSVVIAPLANDSFTGEVSIVEFNIPSEWGTLVDNGDGTFTYLPPLNFSGELELVYTIEDAEGHQSTALVQVIILDVNAPPTASPSEETITQAQAVLFDLRSLVIDAETAANDFIFSLGDLMIGETPAPEAGDLWLDEDGHTAIFIPYGDFAGIVRFTFTAQDEGGLEASETITVTVTRYQDFGDAPDTYGTTLANDGARHRGTHGDPDFPRFGTQVGFEADGQPTNNAQGDDAGTGADIDGVDDEDGIVILAALGARTDGVEVRQYIRLTTPAGGMVDAWLDLGGENGFGTFEASEHIFGGVSLELTAGTHVVEFVLPGNVVDFNGQTEIMTYMRFRISSAGGLGPTGYAEDGEVQDYQLPIFDVTPTPQSLPGLNEAVLQAINDFNTYFPDELEADPNYVPPAPTDPGYVPLSVNGVGAGVGFSQGETDQLVQQAVQQINSIAKTGLNPGESAFILVLHPVDFIVTDPQGRQVGHVAGQTINQIGGSVSYSGDGAVELLVIRNAVAGEYKIDFIGVGGTFRGGATLVTPQGETVSTFQGQLGLGQAVSLALDYSAPTQAVTGNSGNVLFSGNPAAVADATPLDINQALLNVLDTAVRSESVIASDKSTAVPTPALGEAASSEESPRRKFDEMLRSLKFETKSISVAVFDELVFDWLLDGEDDEDGLIEKFWQGLGQSILGGVPHQVYQLGEILGVDVPNLFLPSDDAEEADPEATPVEESRRVPLPAAPGDPRPILIDPKVRQGA